MDSRSSKYRSLDAKGSTPPSKPRDRHNSAPSSDRQKSQHSRRPSATSKPSDSASKASKPVSRDDPTALPDRTAGKTRKPDRHHTASHSLEAKPTRKATDSDNCPVINVLIIGAPNCGKTSFIRNTLDSKLQSSGTSTSSARVVLTEQLYSVRFLELEIDDVDFSSDRRIIWPASVDGEPFPDVDAVFCVYDASDRDSVAAVPTALTSMTNTGVRCMLVASKCDKPESEDIRARFHEQVRRNLATIAVAEVSMKTPENTRRHFLAMLHRIVSSPKVLSRSSAASPRHKSTQHTNPRATSPKTSRSRSRSNNRLRVSKSKELLLNMSHRPAIIESADEETETSSAEEDPQSKHQKTRLRLDTTKLSEPHQRPNIPDTPDSSEEQTSRIRSPINSTSTAVPETPDSCYVKSMLRRSSAETADSRVHQTFLNMDEENDQATEKPDGHLESSTDGTVADENAKQDAGVPLRSLVAKLLVLPANKSDSKFVPSFLCLYRAFTTPQKLLLAIIDQFMEVDKSQMVHFTKVAEMLRYLQVLAQWTATYPGDFASGPARDTAVPFIQSIETSKVFAPAAREISNNLQTLIADEDADWAYDDSPATSGGKGQSSGSKKATQASSSSTPRSETNISAAVAQKPATDIDDSDEDGDGTNSSTRNSGAPSASSSITKIHHSSSQSYTNLMQLESAKLQAQRYKPVPHIRLSKYQWRYFMELPIDDLAREITRIDWTMYSAIRPRDFVRHVSLTTEQKRKSRQVDNIGIMVKQFNHLALFVSGMILLRDKPKHRAKALEKFMALAWKVRQLNNYNSLGAIVAGISGHEISRLSSTRDLIPSDAQKQFMRLTILMGISRSHAAYRMAWDNSSSERIPFLPLIRQDLTMAASANPTFIGSNINWKKFEIMGDVIVSVQKSLETPYSFSQRTHHTDEIIKLILETKIVDDSEILEVNYTTEVYKLNPLELIQGRNLTGYGVNAECPDELRQIQKRKNGSARL